MTCRAKIPDFCAQQRAAVSITLCRTACRSKLERLMTLSSADVAVCCSSLVALAADHATWTP